MARKRANGDGSITKLSGNRRKPWAVRVTVGWNEKGKQQIKYVGTYATKAEAKTALRNYLLNPYNLDKVTFEAVFNGWIAKADLKEGTLYNHNNAFGKMKRLYKKEISKITLKDLEDLIAPYKPTVQGSMRKTMRVMYKYAMKHDYVQKDITQHLEIAEHTNVKEINIFTPQEIQELWNNVGTEYFDDMPLILLYTGLRISELLNIKIEDINIPERYIFIPDSKTKNGIRKVPIHEKIVPLLEKRYNEEQTYLFLNPRSKKQQTYTNFIKNHWKLEHTRHEARHTFVSAITKVVPDRIIIKLIVGHSKGDITDKYTHRDFSELLEAINKVQY